MNRLVLVVGVCCLSLFLSLFFLPFLGLSFSFSACFLSLLVSFSFFFSSLFFCLLPFFFSSFSCSSFTARYTPEAMPLVASSPEDLLPELDFSFCSLSFSSSFLFFSLSFSFWLFPFLPFSDLSSSFLPPDFPEEPDLPDLSSSEDLSLPVASDFSPSLLTSEA